jgi:hypothetical protein
MGDYDSDILMWSESQAALLRRLAAGEHINDLIDWENVAEEVESVGREQLHAVESLLFQALVHILKAQGWPDSVDARKWRADARGFAAQARRRFVDAFARYGLVGTPLGLILAHTCLAVPFVVTSVTSSLAGFDRRLEMAALSLGATPIGTFWQVTFPLIRPGVVVGALFAFITSFDELIVSLFLSGTNAVTLPRRMWEDLRSAIDPTIAAVSVLTIVVTVLPLIWVRAGRGR